MTYPEFQEWVKHHRACYSGLSTFLDGLAVKPKKEGEPSRADVLTVWFYALKDVNLDVAKEASSAMHRGDYAEPMGWARHPAMIRSIAVQARDVAAYRPPQYTNGRQTYQCRDCEDDGWVVVWHWVSMQAAQIGTLGTPGTLMSCAVACTCPAGDCHMKSRAMRFDTQKMLPVLFKQSEQEQDALREFMARSIEWKPQMSYEDVVGSSETQSQAF